MIIMRGKFRLWEGVVELDPSTNLLGLVGCSHCLGLLMSSTFKVLNARVNLGEELA